MVQELDHEMHCLQETLHQRRTSLASEYAPLQWHWIFSIYFLSASQLRYPRMNGS